jgi:hypothetical protein
LGDGTIDRPRALGTSAILAGAAALPSTKKEFGEAPEGALIPPAEVAAKLIMAKRTPTEQRRRPSWTRGQKSRTEKWIAFSYGHSRGVGSPGMV